MTNGLKQISSFIWEIPTTFRKSMKVPVKIIASKALLQNFDEAVFEQAINVASLPGLVEYVFILPDAHSGYGAPIGCVFATDPKNGGVISPGAVGYDINCLPPDSEILSGFGYRRRIIDFENDSSIPLACLNLSKQREENASISLVLKKHTNPHLLRITTKLGFGLHVTPDHPLYTNKGMVKAQSLSEGDQVSIIPFEGVPYKEPSNEIILNFDSIRNLPLPFISSYSRDCLIKELRKRKLIPLYYNSPMLPFLIKLIAYNMGDGNLTFTLKTQSSAFWGKSEDLDDVAADLKLIGYHPHRFSRKRTHQIETITGEKRFNTEENSLHLQNGSLVLLLHALGAPVGNKARQNYRIPQWLKKAPLWQKRLFLAAYFGAEMSKPKVMTDNKTTFYMPAVSVNKAIPYLESGYNFLGDLRELLNEFKISTTEVKEVDEHIGRSGIKSKRLRLHVFGTNDNLIKFYSKINFEYNREKRFLANIAVQYLKFKEKILKLRSEAEQLAKKFYKGRGTQQEVVNALKSKFVSQRFIHRSIFENRKTRVRIPPNFPSFKKFLKERTNSLGRSGAVWDEIESIDLVPYSGYVYDFTVDHQSHNFIANNFLVSNCGMRLITTNLSEAEIKPYLERLVETLFLAVPAGVGGKGFLKISDKQLEEIMVEGAFWMIKKGYGRAEDLQNTEEGGKVKGAEPVCVSEKARQRGKHQLATLGSGNHYLEIQKVAEIFDKDTALKLGIGEVGQIVVMIHCGSRGFGHQICSDYLRIFENHMRDYKITVADRQLACAPFNSSHGQRYFGAMNAAANFAYANRQAITYQVRKVFQEVMGKSEQDLRLDLVYDVTHNMAKIEKHQIDLVVHRKGTTRSYPGQPVIIGGSMESGSFLLLGTESALSTTFGSTAHGSGRTMSRHAAARQVSGKKLSDSLKLRGIYVRSASWGGLAEEAGIAYKNIDEVVEAIVSAGISQKVARLTPIGNIKG